MYADGLIVYYYNNALHRTDGPAMICANGNKGWYINGILHREDGPAIEHTNGNNGWYIDGSCYVSNKKYIDWYYEEGPAIEDTNVKIWCQYGKKHRENGPAVKWQNGNDEYWFCGVPYTIHEYRKLLKL